jgi:hypothetical protein
VEPEKSIEAALDRGASTLTRWTQDGTLIPPQHLAKAWDQDLQTVRAAVQRKRGLKALLTLAGA